MKKGFSVLKAIIVLFFITAFSVGGYFGYNNYIAPMLNPNSAFIPESLQEYARGEDAEIILIFNDEASQFGDLLEEVDAPEETEIGLKSALVLVSYSFKCGYAALEFESTDKADEFKEMVENDLFRTEEDIVIDQKDKILTVSIDDDKKCLKGNLKDNPLFKSLDPEYVDNQVVLVVDNEELSALSFLLMGTMSTVLNSAGTGFEAAIPRAHAQMISPGDSPQSPSLSEATVGDATTRALLFRNLSNILFAAENSTIYSKLDESDMNVTIKVKIMEEEELEKSYIFKQLSSTIDIAHAQMINPGDAPRNIAGAVSKDTLTFSDTDEFYEEIEKLFNEDLNDMFKELEEETDNFEGSSEYKDLVLTFNFKFNLKKAIEDAMESTLKAESRGRDAARRMHLNNMVAALEAFNSDNGHYPKESACFEDDDFIEKDMYFAGGNSPKDPNGEQTFGDIICDDGYYYQFINGGYVLWAKMENEMNGDTNLTPEELEELTSKGIMPESEDEGDFYFLNQLGSLPQPEKDSDEGNKVPRKI